jgi:RIO-like serine/threonine protein kinase
MFKILREFKNGMGSLRVTLVEDDDKSKIVLKEFKTMNKYRKEIELYDILKDSDYVPNVVYRDDERKVLGIEFCGESLNNKFKPKDRYRFKSIIRSAISDIELRYGIYHNDIRWKNICLNSDGKILFVDWERWDYVNKERDPEFILTDRKIKV